MGKLCVCVWWLCVWVVLCGWFVCVAVWVVVCVAVCVPTCITLLHPVR